MEELSRLPIVEFDRQAPRSKHELIIESHPTNKKLVILHLPNGTSISLYSGDLMRGVAHVSDYSSY